MIVIVIGVSGAGKTDVGSALAARLGCRFIDADDHHPAANVAKMATGTPLADEDRWPWLDELNRQMRASDAAGETAVLACSALKQAYRDRLAAGLKRCEFVFLNGSFELIDRRLAGRRHRYMPASLLESQFAALEPPRGAIEVNAADAMPRCVESICAALKLR